MRERFTEGTRFVEITIKGEAKEIADLLLAVGDRQEGTDNAGDDMASLLHTQCEVIDALHEQKAKADKHTLILIAIVAGTGLVGVLLR